MPLQIAVVLFENGKEVEQYNQYFKAKKTISEEAFEIHGLNKKKLKELKAKPFNKTQAKVIMQFLQRRNELPITSFNIDFDRDKVLKPAFKELGLVEMDDTEYRWRCAQDLCKRTGNWKLWSLDDALEHFGFERRKEDARHDALNDARLAALVYMKAIKLPALKEAGLGFTQNEEE